jgi:non-ribosomal peptide synthetase component F
MSKLVYTAPLLALVPTALSAQTTVTSIIVSFTEALGPLVAALTSVAVAVFVWGMVVFVTKSGDDQGRQAGRQRMIWGIIGLFLIVAVWGIVSLLGTLIGIDPNRTDCKAPQILQNGVSSCY